MTLFNSFQLSALRKWNLLKCDDDSKEKQLISLPPDAKVAFVYDFLKFENLFPNILSGSTKSTAEALEMKNCGNDFFFKGNDIEALKMYTRSVAAALPDSPELAVAYANRSAALYRLGRYQACLVDINRALKGQYPEISKPKLIDRKKNCLTKLATISTNTRDHLKSLASSISDDDTLEENLKYKMVDCDFDVDATDLNYVNRFYLPTTNFKNELIPFASEKIKLNYNHTMGRHIVATKDIQPGEVLSFERAYASCLKFKFDYSHCSNCFVRCEALIPCNTCSKVMYCSVKCREEALNHYHLLECPIIQNPVNLKMDDGAWLAIRILLIATKQGQELEALMMHPIYKNLMKRTRIDVTKKFDSQDYLNIHNMEMNLEKQPDRNWYPYCLMAAFLLHILKRSKYFGSASIDAAQKTKPTMKEKEIFVGNLLLKFYLNLICNSQGILEASNYSNSSILNNRRIEIETTTIGCGIYSFHCVFNHSCDANVTIHSHKDTVVFVSNQPIKAGEQIFSNYGGFYYNTSLLERQSHLRRYYFFDCRCKACEKNWPEDFFLRHFFDKKRPSLRGTKLAQYHEKMQNWQDLISRGDPFSAKLLLTLREMLIWLLMFGEKPFIEHVDCQYSIRVLFWRRANYYGLPQDKILLSL